MSNSMITPVLLAGGAGTRLWPVSRNSYPKQFSQLLGEQSLFQASAKRLATSKKVSFGKPITMTNEDFRFIVVEQLQQIGVDPGPILIEPLRKNTGPAILAAALYAIDSDPEAILLVAPSDHVIPDIDGFHEVVDIGLEEVKKGKIVTFGIEPSKPETGYGYLECSEKPKGKAVSLTRFVEKPNLETAQKMITAGKFLWNAGIFLFKAEVIVEAFEKYCKNLIQSVKASINNGKTDLGFFRLDIDAWKSCENISIDYSIMEKAKNLSVVPFSKGWSDLGGWDAIWEESGPDTKGMVLSKNATAIDCQNSLLRSEGDELQIVGLGLDNIIAVAMHDAVLVADKSRTQDVKKVVTKLQEKKLPQADIFPKDHRPWGWFETLVIQDRFQVKRICVNPDGMLSLQSHFHRSEYWVVVEGTAKVTLDNKTLLVAEGQSVHIPLGARHRLENPGSLPMVLIEVQIGPYLGEDDIVRYEDKYSRETDKK